MKPVHICGPVAWFGADKGEIHVDHGVAAYFLSQTVLPVPLLIEHDPTLQIGKVVRLNVEENRLVAGCVVDDALFISLLKNLQQTSSRYKSKDIGAFLNILLPSFSSYHRTDTFEILEISVVDVGRRQGALWSVSPHTQVQGLQSATAQHIKISLEEVKTKLLTLLLGQRQQSDRKIRLCRDADVCGLSKSFVCASSHSPSSSRIGQSGDMAKPGTADVKSVLTSLLEQHASGDITGAAEVASKNAIYSSEDVRQMMLNLEKKHADRTSLELAMDQLVTRRVAREEIRKQRSGRGTHSGKRKLEVEAITSEEELVEDEQVDNSYTSIPVTKRVQNIMGGHGRSAKKVSVRRRKRAGNKVQEAGDNSDTESEVDGEGEKEAVVVTSKMMGQISEGMKQMVSMMAAFTSRADDSQQQGMQQPMQHSTSVHTPKQDQPSRLNPTGKDGAMGKECVLGQEKAVADVKASALDNKPRRSTVEQIFA